MNPLIRLLTKLYPRPWRDRYGREFMDHLAETGGGWRDAWDVLAGGIGMRVRYLARVAWWKAGVFGALAGLAVGSVVVWKIPDTFLSEAVVRIKDADSKFIQQRVQATAWSLMGRVQRMSTAEVREYSSLVSEGPKGVYRLRFRHTDAATAQRVTRALVSFLPANAEVLDDASFPQTPLSPNRPVVVVISALAGLFTALAILLFLRLRHPGPPPMTA